MKVVNSVVCLSFCHVILSISLFLISITPNYSTCCKGMVNLCINKEKIKKNYDFNYKTRINHCLKIWFDDKFINMTHYL